MRIAQEEKDINDVITDIDRLRATVALANIQCNGRGGMHKHAISAAAHEERYRFIHFVVHDSLRIVHPQLQLLSPFVHA
ncbi:hypothetical protein D3C86_1917030 [compost metagenome]